MIYLVQNAVGINPKHTVFAVGEIYMRLETREVKYDVVEKIITAR